MEYNSGYQNVEPEEFYALLRSPHILIDVRTEQEYENGHILNAHNTPLNEIAGLVDESNLTQEQRPVLVYCLSGNRSATAADIIARAGCAQVYNLQGGIRAWKKVFPI